MMRPAKVLAPERMLLEVRNTLPRREQSRLPGGEIIRSPYARPTGTHVIVLAICGIK